MKINIETEKKKILNSINDLKVNINDVTEINRSLVKEKREGMGVDFHEKNIRAKKTKIMAIIRTDEEIISSGIPKSDEDRIKTDKSRSDEGVKSKIRAAIGSSNKTASFN